MASPSLTSSSRLIPHRPTNRSGQPLPTLAKLRTLAPVWRSALTISAWLRSTFPRLIRCPVPSARRACQRGAIRPPNVDSWPPFERPLLSRPTYLPVRRPHVAVRGLHGFRYLSSARPPRPFLGTENLIDPRSIGAAACGAR